MQTVTILWTLGAAMALTLAAVSGVVWWIERRDRATLMLSILGVATAAEAFGELGMMRSATPAAFGEWLRWYHIPTFVAMSGQLLFIHYYLGTGRRWLLGTVVALRAVVLVVNFSVRPNFNFAHIDRLRQAPLFGDAISVLDAAAARTEWQWVATLSLVLWALYALDAPLRLWREGREGGDARRKALTVALGVAGPFLATLLYTQLLVFGVIRGPVSDVPWLLGTLLMTVAELGRDFVLGRRARLELAELRGRLSQAGRVNLLGQLASAVVHEVVQPLNAIAINADAALLHFRPSASPGFEELRAILDDIARDGRRAVGIVERMRLLFQRSPLALQPLNLDDIVHDVAALVRAEASARSVTLDLQLPPGLPSVQGDRVQVSQVLLNLLLNGLQAVSARPAGARRIRVSAAAPSGASEVEIMIQDSGPGIPAAVAGEIFKPFFTTKPQGMGMGLALSRTIIEAHGGRLWFDRAPSGGGATFRFTLRRVS